jgi:hypothetical protein
LSVVALADDFDVVVAGEASANPSARQRLIIDNEHAHRSLHEVSVAS